MRLLLRRTTWAVASLMLTAGAQVLGDNASQFVNANREYAAGHYQPAIDGYEALVRAGQWNATLFYNLGNARFRRGDLGRAILNYERALALDPHHAEATANLRLVRDQARALELTRSWPERYLALGTSVLYAWMAAAAFWIGIFALAGFLFSRRRSGRALGVMIVAILVCLCATYLLYIIETGNRGRELAIVTAKNIEARLATADTAGSILALPAGSEVKILSTRGDWAYAALPNNLRGWIPAQSAELVRL
jgi:tetratricopeptide (TPR) repeat protein